MPTNNVLAQSSAIEYRLARITTIAWLVPSIGLIVTLWLFDTSLYLIGILSALLSGIGLYCVITVWQKTQYQFRNLHNLLDAIGQGDYSLRGVATKSTSAYSNLVQSINALADTLHHQRLKSEESYYLLEKIVNQFDGAIIAWDKKDTVLILNTAAAKLLDIPCDGEKPIADRSIALPDSLAVAKTMAPCETCVVEDQFGSSHGKYRLHLEQFISGGDIHSLLFMINVSNILREEEKKAWQNLIRVLSHEINNSLAPLSSLSNALQNQVKKRERDPVLASELRDGLSIVENRAKSLQNFIKSYQSIASLPKPENSIVQFDKIIDNLVKLFSDENLRITGEIINLSADPAQLEQVFINLIKNAIDANKSNAKVHDEEKVVDIHWFQKDSTLKVMVKDVGEGIQNKDNIFTPFYTTKDHGSGIGLVLCQQIVEGHGGYLSIANRKDRPGCVVTIELPLT